MEGIIIDELNDLTGYESKRNYWRDPVIKSSPCFNKIKRDKYNIYLKNKCIECSKICNFTDQNRNETHFKKVKKELLYHILDFVSNALNAVFMTDDNIGCILDMIGKNIFRNMNTVIFLDVNNIYNCISDPSWEHLSIVYDILVIISNNYGYKLSFCFIYKLIKNIISTDSNERNVVCKIVITLYESHSSIRIDITKSIFGFLSLGSCSFELINVIITLFKDDEYFAKICLDNIFTLILPLHNCHNYPLYQHKLVELLFLISSKCKAFIPEICSYICRKYPTSDKNKIIPFIKELADIYILFYEFLNNTTITRIILLFSKALKSNNRNVIQLLFSILSSQKFFDALVKTHKISYPIIIPQIIHISEYFWDKIIQLQAANFILRIRKASPSAFRTYKVRDKKRDREEMWRHIETLSNMNTNRTVDATAKKNKYE